MGGAQQSWPELLLSGQHAINKVARLRVCGFGTPSSIILLGSTDGAPWVWGMGEFQAIAVILGVLQTGTTSHLEHPRACQVLAHSVKAKNSDDHSAKRLGGALGALLS